MRPTSGRGDGDSTLMLRARPGPVSSRAAVLRGVRGAALACQLGVGCCFVMQEQEKTQLLMGLTPF